jgi:hypothetical protein
VHVRDLVRVRHHRRRPPRHDRARELRRGDHAGLDVDVGIDQPRDQVRAGQVDDVARFVARAHAGDPIARDRHVSLLDLAREHVHHAAAGEQQVRGGVPAGDGEQIGRIHWPSRAGFARSTGGTTRRDPGGNATAVTLSASGSSPL